MNFREERQRFPEGRRTTEATDSPASAARPSGSFGSASIPLCQGGGANPSSPTFLVNSPKGEL